MDDREIDENFKIILRNRRLGTYLSPEIVAHLEYFMNTLNMGHKAETENPFLNPEMYQALLFKG